MREIGGSHIKNDKKELSFWQASIYPVSMSWLNGPLYVTNVPSKLKYRHTKFNNFYMSRKKLKAVIFFLCREQALSRTKSRPQLGGILKDKI